MKTMVALDDVLRSVDSHSLADNIRRVRSWNPSFSGDIDIVIRANGDWYHEGAKFTRQPLIDLFASLLKKEGDDYYLVTPAEKWRIRVDACPLLVIDCEMTGEKKTHCVTMRTSTGDVFALDAGHPLRMLEDSNGHERPVVSVRDRLDALVARNVYYTLADKAVEYLGRCGIWSSGQFFALD